jgi:23S rRNA pseudouridine2605 synthase
MKIDEDDNTTYEIEGDEAESTAEKEPSEGTKLVRLQKFISECGLASRRAAEKLITDGKVTVNTLRVTELGTKVNPEKDVVYVGKLKAVLPDKGIMLLYKPKGVVTTLSDPEGRRTIADYLTKHYKSYFPVGRLDYESSGLIILTNDGDLGERLLHPRYELTRIYKVKVEGRMPEAVATQICNGVDLEDGIAKGQARILSTEGKYTWVEIRVKEGRNRLVRRIMDRVGFPVDSLVRIAHGPFKLGSMKPGELKKLTEREYKYFKTKTFLSKEERADVERRSEARRDEREASRRAAGPAGRRKSFGAKKSPFNKKFPGAGWKGGRKLRGRGE